MALAYNQMLADNRAPKVDPMPKRDISWWDGKRLVSLRERKDWPQDRVAKALGVTIQAVSKWERTLDAPSNERIFQLHRLFSASADYLLGLVEEPYQHVEEEKLPPDERKLLELYRTGKLPKILGDILLAQLESGEDQQRLIEDKTGRKPGKDKTSDR